MDNVTHALFGYALARAMPQNWQATRERRSALVWASVLGSNLPDIDFIAAYFTSDRKLGYLVHHRGHTHTILLAVPIGIACAWVATKFSRLRADSADWKRLLALGVTAALLHVGADALNNYGVHPFFPIDDRWHYGDVFFIIEPLVLFSLLPVVLFDARTRWGRMTGAAIAMVALALMWRVLPLGPSVFATVWFAACCVAQWRLRKSPSASPTVVAFGGLVVAAVSFASGSVAADRAVRSHYGSTYANEALVDVVRTPIPGMPICWDLITVSTNPARELVLRRGSLSLGPHALAHVVCRFTSFPTTAPMRPLVVSGDGPRIDSELRLRLSDLDRLRSSCRAQAILTFTRAPFWIFRDDANVVLGDLRYDRAPPLEFSEFLVNTRDTRCTSWVPPWIPKIAGL